MKNLVSDEELRDAYSEIENLQQWVDDLQSGMYINCVYCGHQYGPEDEFPSMREALEEHVVKCHKHPMSKIAHDLKEAQDEIKRIDAAGEAVAHKLITVESAYEIQAEELRDAYAKIERMQVLLDGAREGA